MTGIIKSKKDLICGCNFVPNFVREISNLIKLKIKQIKQANIETKQSIKIHKKLKKAQMKRHQRILFVGFNETCNLSYKLFCDTLKDDIWHYNEIKTHIITELYIKYVSLNIIPTELTNIISKYVYSCPMNGYNTSCIINENISSKQYKNKDLSLSYINYDRFKRKYKTFNDTIKVFVLTENEYIGHDYKYKNIINKEGECIIFISTNKAINDINIGLWSINNRRNFHVHRIIFNNDSLKKLDSDTEHILIKNELNAVGIVL